MAYMIGEQNDKKGCANKTKTLNNQDNSSISTPCIMDQIKGLTVQYQLIFKKHNLQSIKKLLMTCCIFDTSKIIILKDITICYNWNG